MQSLIEEVEHAWCQDLVKTKKEILNFGAPITKIGRRQKFDCRTPEAKIQHAVFKLYEPVLLDLDQQILNKRHFIIPFEKSSSQCDEELINTLGKATFDKFQHRFTNKLA